ncbi:MAG: hypothetical protein VB078_11055 [Clostridiaceae bacterium]|nr:hypothetical protein [Clostridiaceae bacterium]
MRIFTHPRNVIFTSAAFLPSIAFALHYNISLKIITGAAAVLALFHYLFNTADDEADPISSQRESSAIKILNSPIILSQSVRKFGMFLPTQNINTPGKHKGIIISWATVAATYLGCAIQAHDQTHEKTMFSFAPFAGIFFGISLLIMSDLVLATVLRKRKRLSFVAQIVSAICGFFYICTWSLGFQIPLLAAAPSAAVLLALIFFIIRVSKIGSSNNTI